jgi:hypothetical protein
VRCSRGAQLTTASRPHRCLPEHIARDLADVAAQLASLKGEVFSSYFSSYLREPNLYTELRLRLEEARAAVEAAVVEASRRVRMHDEGARRERDEKSGPAHATDLQPDRSESLVAFGRVGNVLRRPPGAERDNKEGSD